MHSMYAQYTQKVLTMHSDVTDLRISSYIMDILSHEVSEAVGQEHGTKMHLHLTVKKTGFLQLLQLHTLS